MLTQNHSRWDDETELRPNKFVDLLHFLIDCLDTISFKLFVIAVIIGGLLEISGKLSQ